MTYPHINRRTCHCCCLVLDDNDVIYKCAECGGECCMTCIPDGQFMPDHENNKCRTCIDRENYYNDLPSRL